MSVSNIRKDIKKDDTVIVLSGNYKKTIGKVLKVFPSLNKFMVEGVNKVKKHQKPGGNNPGGIVEKQLLINASNVSLVDMDTKKAIKVGFKRNDKGKKLRINKKTDQFID